MYSETGNDLKAVIIARQALDLAEKQQNGDLASALRASLARYQRQADAESATPAPEGSPRP
jgi:hypothetical protein